MTSVGMLGSKIKFQVKGPDLTQEWSTQPQAVVSGSYVEFTNINQYSANGGNIVDANVDIDANSISIFYGPDHNGWFADGEFNGYVFTDSENKIARIIGASIDPEITLVIGSKNIFFDENNLYINVAGLDYYANDVLKVTLSFANEISGDSAGNKLTGTSGKDDIYGLSGNDSIDGGSNVDYMYGGDGNDVYYVRDIGDLVTETNATQSTGGTDTVYSYLSTYQLTANVERGQIMLTGAANLTGNTENNILYAGKGNNVLNGGSGTDTVSYAYGLSETAGVTVSLASATAQATGGSGSDTLIGIENLDGSAQGDKLTGNSSANTLAGGAGNDSMAGGLGNDFLLGGAGTDIAIFSGKSSDYQLGYSNFQFTITDKNVADGNGGIDRLNSIERLQFSDKTITFDTASQTSSQVFANNGYYGTLADLAKAAYHLSINEDKSINCVKPYADDAWVRVNQQMHVLKGSDLGMSFFGYDNIGELWMMDEEGVFHQGNAAAIATRSGDAVYISFRGTNDNDNGSHGTQDESDWIYMGSHYSQLTTFIDKFDAYVEANNIAKVYVTGHSLGGGIALGYMMDHKDGESVTANGTSISYEAVTFAAPKYPSVLSVNDDRIIAFEIDGDPVPDAGLGINPGQIVGLNIEGLPTDTYPVAGLVNPLDFVNWHSMDLYMAAVRMLDKELPSTTQKTSTLIHGFDRSLFNWFDGVEAVFNAAEIFPADSELSLYTGNLVPQFAIADGNDRFGSSSNWGTSEYFMGGAGDDYLIASNYSNWLMGGSGFDWVSYETATSGVTVSLAVSGAQATGGSGTDTLRSIEALYGSKFNDKFTGTLGNNIFDGQGGYDTVSYANATSAVTVTLNGATAASVTVGGVAEDSIKNIENLIGGSAADTFSGDSLANVFKGGVGKDVLNGNGGIDTADYSDKTSAVTVTLNGATAASVTVGGVVEDSIKNIENLIGGSAADTFSGDSLANILNGGSGNDTLIGGIGKDTLVGGNGNDLFDFNALPEMGTTSTTWDVIKDFIGGQDKIDLATLDANTATTTNDAFNGTLIASTISFTAAGQLKLASGVLYGNTDADSTAEFAIQLTGITALSASDFVL